MSFNIILCGLPGVGKTTIGKVVASQIGWHLVDSDKDLELYYKKLSGKTLTCRQIYTNIGEEQFRILENQLISQFLHYNEYIISVGAGMLNYPKNIELLKKIGKIIYLKNERSIVYERIVKNEELPAYLDPSNPFDSFQKLAQRRELIYESAADYVIDTKNLTPIEIAIKIIAII